MNIHLLSHLFYTLTLLCTITLKTSSAQYDQNKEEEEEPYRILYIVTTSSEYNNGERGTKQNQDRLREMVLPVLIDSIQTMISPPHNYHVDLYLILGYKLREERQRMIEEALPDGVGLEVWDEAIPMGYTWWHQVKDYVHEIKECLSRQHRYVIKDKLFSYDFFVAFEDDMRITGDHISYFLQMSSQIDNLIENAPDTISQHETMDGKQMKEHYHGPMTKRQLKRLMPGFIRVEVLLDEEEYGSQIVLDNIPVDLEFEVVTTNDEGDGSTETTTTFEEKKIDPNTCCNAPTMIEMGGKDIPPNPQSDDLIIWETGIKNQAVRKMPESSPFSWVMVQSGPKDLDKEDVVGGYWSGTGGDIFDRRPVPANRQYVSQQAGFMATREKIIELDEVVCKGGFLPPFDGPEFEDDGLIQTEVEFWSGGLQLFTAESCNIQRILDLRPEKFSKHLLYHTANNKQRHDRVGRERLVRANNFLGQLNTVKKRAEQALESVSSA